MEDRKMTEKESLQLISQMIQNTQKRVEKNCGTPFLIWGYTTVFISLAIWFLLRETCNYQWNFLWFALPIISFPATLWVSRKNESMVKNYIDRVVSYVWIVFGVSAFFVSILAMFYRVPILFMVLLLMGMGTALTGMIIRFKVLMIAGFVGLSSSVSCLLVKGENLILVFAAIFVIMMIVPGHLLNRAASKK